MFFVETLIRYLSLGEGFSQDHLMAVIRYEVEFYAFLLEDGRKAVLFHGYRGVKPYSQALISAAQGADLILCCNPIQQEGWMREKHIVPFPLQRAVEVLKPYKGMNLVTIRVEEDADPFSSALTLKVGYLLPIFGVNKAWWEAKLGVTFGEAEYHELPRM